MTKKLASVEVIEDRAERVGPRDGFLKLQRLMVRNVYADGTRSPPYACDVVSRRHVDAVTVVLYQRTPQGILVGLRENLRVPVWLRRASDRVPFADAPRHDTLLETVAGVIESDGDDHLAALRARAAAECREEVGLDVASDRIAELGGAAFPSPGITDEKVYFAAAEVDLSMAQAPEGDGSVMEEVGGLVVLPLSEALARCRDGRIADMKTEIALRRLAERLGPSAAH